MDELRASVKAIYYEYPIENIFAMVVGKDSSRRFLSPFAQLACIADKSLSPRGMDSYKDELLIKLKQRGFKRDNDITLMAGLPLLFAEKVLTRDGADYPCVRFENLLRWREVVKHVGEDLFTTAYLAQADRRERRDFFWPNVIVHDKEEINAILDQGLSDIHAHFGGAIDSFQFNWICLMNDVERLYDKFELMKQSFYQPVVLDKDYAFSNLSEWCKVAAAIRVCLYKVLIQGKSYRKDDIMLALLSIGTERGSEKLTRLKEAIDSLRAEAKQTCGGVTLDYAIGEELVTEAFSGSPYCIYAGERQLEYAFYRRYLKGTSALAGWWVELFYLYELVKTHLRREFVCANEKSGLDNYIGFGARAALFTKKIEPICNLSAMQTSIRQDKDDYIETRVTSNALGLTRGEYWKGLYTSEPFLEQEEMRKRLSFVIQLTKGGFSKKEHREGRYYRKKAEIHAEYNKVAYYKDTKQSAYEIVGLDVGGMELFYRPEVFAHALRCGKEQGFRVTFHVGEEFYDLVDGMRAIWEVMQYTASHPIDRLGHCLALGVQAETYYRNNHYSLTMPKQLMLDNVVWLCGYARRHGIRIKRALQERLERLAEDLYAQIGYGRFVARLDMDDYYSSLYLRSDEANPEDGLDGWSRTAELDTAEANRARLNLSAVNLFNAYRLNADVIEAGEEPVTERFDKAYAALVDKVQQAMIERMNRTGLCIESCPSSNLQICKLERYDRHPAIRYYLRTGERPFWRLLRRPRLNVAVCTDDKGTFATSLHNELSLLALAATKKKRWNRGIEGDFIRLMNQGSKYRFKKASNDD